MGLVSIQGTDGARGTDTRLHDAVQMTLLHPFCACVAVCASINLEEQLFKSDI